MDFTSLCNTCWPMLSLHDLTVFHKDSCDVAECLAFAAFKWPIRCVWCSLSHCRIFLLKEQTRGRSIGIMDWCFSSVRVESILCRCQSPEEANQPPTLIFQHRVSLWLWNTVRLLVHTVIPRPPQVFFYSSEMRIYGHTSWHPSPADHHKAPFNSRKRQHQAHPGAHKRLRVVNLLHD